VFSERENEMHLRTFKTRAAKLFQKANPDWQIVGTEFGPKRGKRPMPFRGYLDEAEREFIHWRVWIQNGNRKAVVHLNWGYSTGFWIK
jgi:hypothetical protein